MYNPNQDIVAGRTAKQIEAAKRRAVKGGGRKRCKKGKSCGATCINGSKVCLVDLPWVSSNGLSKVAKDIQNRPTSKAPAGEEKLTKFLSEMETHYKGIRKINDDSMPDAEKDWRRKELQDKIDGIRAKAEAEIGKLTSGKDEALAKFKEKEEKLRINSLGEWKISKEADEALISLGYSRSGIHNSRTMMDQDPEYYGGKLKMQLAGFEKYRKEAEAYISAMTPGEKRDSFTRRLKILTDEIKVPKTGSLEDASKAGREFMAKHEETLKAALSIMRRFYLVEESIKERLKDENLGVKERIRLKKVLFRLGQKSTSANVRSYELMESIRNELLKTKLSDQDIKGIISRIKMTGKGIPESDVLFTKVRGQLEEFARMFNGKGLTEMDDNGVIKSGLREVSIDPKGRAFARKGFISINGESRTLFHEAGHIVEDSVSWLGRYAEKWRDGKAYSIDQINKDRSLDKVVRDSDGNLISYTLQSKAVGQGPPIFRLGEMPVHKGWAYGPNEVAMVDKFMTIYMGKVYEGTGGTEVVSVGMEKFSSPSEMRHLYSNHPDLFKTIVGLALT